MQQTVALGVARSEALAGVREMAALTSVSPSTVTRYLQRYPELGVEVDGQTKVRRAAYLDHRSDNPGVEDTLVQDDDPKPTPSAIVDLPARKAKQRHEEARAELAELELAKLKGELVSAGDVQAALADKMQMLRDRMIGIDMEFAERVMAAASPREAALMMADRAREAIAKLLADLTKSAT